MSNIEIIEDFILELKTFGLNKDALGVANELENILTEREQDKKRIEELEEENKIQRKQIMSAFNRGWIPKQKVKDVLIEIQEAFNKLDKEVDMQIKDKNKDYYKCRENIAIMQTLAYCRDKIEELLEGGN